MKAVVMAGGEGSRLRPLTSSRPKPLAPVANKPVMHHIVDLLRRHGITDVVATLHYLADEIENYFGDGTEMGVTMAYVVEDTPLGTAGAIKLAQPLLGNERFLIVSGDALTDIDLTELIALSPAREGAAATIALQRVSNPLEFGVVVTDERGRITRFLEKPSWGEVFSDTINTGIYVLEPEIFEYMEPGKNYDFSRDLVSAHAARRQAALRTRYRRPTGATSATCSNICRQTTTRFRERFAWNSRAPRSGPASGRAKRAASPPTRTSTARWHRAQRHDRGRRGRRRADRRRARRRSSQRTLGCIARVTWEDVYVGEGATLTGCTLADRVIVKDRVTILEGAVVGRGSTLGSGSTVPSNIKLWPDKSVAAGSIVSMSLIYGIKWPGSLFGADGVSGLANIEITPEFTLKLGQALGSVLRPGQTVMTSRDAHPASRLTNRCIIAGLLVGRRQRAGSCAKLPTPVSRHAVRASGDAGVHTGISPRRFRSVSDRVFRPSWRQHRQEHRAQRSRTFSSAKTFGGPRWSRSAC